MKLKKISNNCHTVEDHSLGVHYVFSYETLIGNVDTKDGVFNVFFSFRKCSKTTSKHINQVAEFYGVAVK